MYVKIKLARFAVDLPKDLCKSDEARETIFTGSVMD